jgi:hypothetical protein
MVWERMLIETIETYNLWSYHSSIKKNQGKWPSSIDLKLGYPIVINLNLKVIKLEEIVEYKEEIGDELKRVMKGRVQS